MPGNKIHRIVPPSCVNLSSKPLFLHCILAWKDHFDTASTCDPHTGTHFLHQLRKTW